MIKVRVLEHTPNPENVVANAARLCYSNLGIEDLFSKYTDEQNQKMIENLMNLGHESPIEHVSFTFGVEGISRTLSHQLVRHRIASYSQQSQRYVKLDQFEYVIPPHIEKSMYAKKIFIESMKKDQQTYDELVEVLIANSIHNNYLEKMYQSIKILLPDHQYINDVCEVYNTPFLGVTHRKYISKFKECYKDIYSKTEKEAIEDARYVFPNACETKIVFTMNARSLLNLFKLRSCNRAQWEIRELSDKMLIECKKIAPNLFKYAGASCMFGKCPEGKMTCGNPRKVSEYE